MLNKELLEFVRDELAYLTSLNTVSYNKDIEKRAYAQTVKLSEEVGELSEAILAKFNNQKRDKNGKVYSVEDEIADVIVVILILCEHLGVDANAALSKKLLVIKERRKVATENI